MPMEEASFSPTFAAIASSLFVVSTKSFYKELYFLAIKNYPLDYE